MEVTARIRDVRTSLQQTLHCLVLENLETEGSRKQNFSFGLSFVLEEFLNLLNLDWILLKDSVENSVNKTRSSSIHAYLTNPAQKWRNHTSSSLSVAWKPATSIHSNASGTGGHQSNFISRFAEAGERVGLVLLFIKLLEKNTCSTHLS